ncbi:protein mono-ADP-ribosyltransferase PARP15-like [Rhinoderma darwinii]|uniref:protein mono-ADP-ribosyltransferase PARP15-like n=1 Tax=Rhinoderma darwinii TaxID=43563 RepID=UPI003F667AD4
MRLEFDSFLPETSVSIIHVGSTKNFWALVSSIGVSKAILTKAGPIVKEECAHLAKLPNDGVVVTSAGNLKCKKILHVIDVKPEGILTSVKKVLKACDQHNMATISFPAMGTGEAKLDANSSARLLIRALEDYLNDPTTRTSIYEIVIVVLEESIYDVYVTFFRNYKTNYHHFSTFGTSIELFKGDITLQASDCVVNLTNKSLNQSSGVSGAILTAAGDTVKEECKRIGVLLPDGVAITSGGELKGKKIMHIIGPTTVPDYEPSIDRILLECNKNGFSSVALPAIGTGMARIDPEESIKAILNSILNYLSKTPIPTLQNISIVVIQENIYTKYLEVFQAKSTEIQALKREEYILLAIHAQVRIDFPLTWTNTGQSDHQEVPVSKDSTEYKDVENKFLNTALPNIFVVLEIKRIQSVKLWQSFTLKKQAVERKNPGKKNVRHLYHGTTSTVTDNINRGGFNRIYHSKNGTACGTGTYFSIGSNYATGDRYSVPDSNGNKYVYQASVVTGRYCQGKSDYKEPPHIKNDPNGDRYDSVVDKILNKTYFVVFYDDYAYPEYLITFNTHTP